jgi:sulfhydrogenase subunit beta (sulfur reductase)
LRILKLKKRDLKKFLESTSSFGELWAPVKKGERYSYQKVSVKDVDPDAGRTILPLKKFMVPQRFTMFKYDQEGYQELLSDIKDRVVFGAHSCDIAGLNILDKLFKETYPDPYYIQRRKKTAIIGISCTPDKFCFCDETGTDSVDEGFDLFLSEVGSDFYLAWVGSSLGDDLTRNAEGLFDENVSQEDIQKFTDWKEEREKAFKLDIDLTAMPSIYELSLNNKVWEKIGDRCLACGSCSMVCPTCNCYNVTDTVALKEIQGTRDRAWDACTLCEYSLVAGGLNFRATKADRLKLWYTHKLEAFVGAYGKPSCVGCGRCLTNCPVDINVYTVAKTLRGEEVFFK